ncbi:multicopper oxidase domain-containing protein [Flavobacterium poyangense]|uniref:multicopper oxidase domain-containing protein n=1 Tax=Flavobacterium poyangense TaxID=2204302 RepID=UPI001421F19C|nr:multicopper oxidase domain-containing protein [Flavobacterium sp. JXAS1]
MNSWSKHKLVFPFLFVSVFLFAQNERLIIGRTTGKLTITKNVTIRTFGFTDSLSGQVTFPGSEINVREGDSVKIDFWSISQGNPVSLYCREIEFEQRNKENEVMKVKEPIHHMEHGFYSFQAKKAGTYLYYSPENYPFNLQAGMFGVIIVQPKDTDSTSLKASQEVLWCSNEIDTKWHTDAIMGTEYDPRNKPIVLPGYKPDYFLINGEMAINHKGLHLPERKKETVLLRLVNSGLYLHEIAFPTAAKLKLISGSTTAIEIRSEGSKVTLQPGQCFELLIDLENVVENEQIRYQFIDPVSKLGRYEANIPVFYKNLNKEP